MDIKISSKWVIQTCKYIVTAWGIYMLWILLHFIASHLYTHFCVPMSLIGFLLSPVIMTNPYCVCLRWIIFNAGNSICNMWTMIVTFLASKLLN